MTLRATQNLVFGSTQSQLSRAFGNLFETQTKLASGRRIELPSDDPVGSARLLDHRAAADRSARFAENAAAARSFVDTSGSSLQGIGEIVIDVRELVIQGLNGTVSSESRGTLAETIDGHIDDIIALANTKLGDRYLFGGTASRDLPFSRINDVGGDRVLYAGNEDRIHTEIGPGLFVETSVPGSVLGAELFQELIDIRDGLRDAGASGSIDTDLAAVRDRLADLDQSHELLLSSVGRLGSTANRLTAAETRLGDVELRLRELVSEVRDVDVTEAVIDLERNEAAYQAVLLVASRVNDLSLMNFLR